MNLTIRRAQTFDAQPVFNLRNDKRIAEHSHNKKIILLADHMKWFETKLLDANSAIFIAEANGLIAGVTRFDLKKDVYLVSIYTNPEFWGKGLGKKILLESESMFCKENPSPVIFEAEVYKNNISSVKLFEGCHYKLFNTSEEVLTYRKSSL